MKHSFLVPSLFCLLLALSACSVPASPAGPAASQGQTTLAALNSSAPPAADAAPGAAAPAAAPAQAPIAPDTAPVQNAPAEAAPLTEADETNGLDHPADVTALPSVQVELLRNEFSLKNASGVVLVETSYMQPHVTALTDDASAAIQAVLDDCINDFLDYANGEALADAQECYTFFAAQPSQPGETFPPASLTLRFTVQRADNAVLSIVSDCEGYLTPAAHGWDHRCGLNFDPFTGELLTFEALGGQDFLPAARELLLHRAEEMQTASEASGTPLFFPEYADEIDQILRDGSEQDPPCSTFYLGRDGLSFISGEYVLQPYASGIVELKLPYEALEGILNESYLP